VICKECSMVCQSWFVYCAHCGAKIPKVKVEGLR